MSEHTPTAGSRRTARKMVMVALGMFGFGYALVPLYDVFCDITGLNGKTGRLDSAQAAGAVDRERTVTVEFVANVNGELPWEFAPVVRKMEVHPGALMEADFIATNRSAEAMTGNAVPSVAPGRASRYFSKTECFCFTAQRLEAGESRDMPLRFVVDPRLPEDVRTLTLSYTFFDSAAAGVEDRLEPPGQAG